METKKKMTLHRFWVIWSYIEAALLVAAGALAIVFGIVNDTNGAGSVEAIVAYVIGAFVIMGAIIRLIKMIALYQSKDDDVLNSVLFVGIEASLGITILITEANYDNVIFTIASFISVLLMVSGALFLLFSIVNIARHISTLTMPIVAILGGAILIGVGTAIMILYHQSNNAKVVLILIGSVMASAGITMAIITAITNRKKKNEDRAGANVVEERKAEKAIEKKPKGNEIVPAEGDGEDK